MSRKLGVTRRAAHPLVAIGLCATLFGAPPAVAFIEGDSWFPIGPAPIDGFFAGGAVGRASAIAVNPSNADEVYLGTAAGGVWHTVDDGRNWTPRSDKQAALAIGSIALGECNASGCRRIYAGTGENAKRRDTYYGSGLLVGEWSGQEFPVLGWTLRTGSPFDFSRGSIIDVVVDPTTSGSTTRLFVALARGVTVSATEATVTAPAPASGSSGLYKSEDNGATWQAVAVPGSGGAEPTDLEMAASDPNVLYAGFMGRGIFKSVDKGLSWCPLNEGVPLPAGCPDPSGLLDVSSDFDHVEVALFPGNSQVIYGRFGFCSDRLLQNCVPGIYRSTDGGATWVQRLAGNPAHSAAGPRGYSRYTQALAVDPTNQNRIIVGGIDLWRSTDGGQTYTRTDGLAVPGAPGGGESAVHSDHREVVFHPIQTNRAYNTSDGGFAVSDDSGASWTPRNDDLQITGFQSIGASPLTGSVIGASQDNAAQLWSGSRRWRHQACCGDGGFSFLDHDDVMTLYAASNHGEPNRSTNGGVSWSAIENGIASTDHRLFYAPFIQGPAPSFDLFYGATRLYRSTNDGTLWTAISPVLATGTSTEITTAGSTLAHIANPVAQNVITAIGVAPSNANRIYVGYYNGEILVTSAPCTAASCWERVDTSSQPNAPVTRIAVHSTNPNIAYATFSGFGSGARVWRTTNGGSSWSARSNGLPSGVPANTITVEPGAPGRVWVGLDSGPDGASLYKSTNGGASWSAFSKGLANAPIYEIVIDETHGRAYAATHGRGAFVVGEAFISTFEGWVDDSIWDVPIYGQNFLPNQSCTVRILQSTGDACATGSTDADGGAIRTDGNGVLVTDRAGFYNGRPVAWGCLNGTCIGGAPIAECNDDANGDGVRDPLSTVIVNCGGQVATTTVRGCPTLAEPPTTTLGLDLGSGSGAGAGGGGGPSGGGGTDGAPLPEERTFELSASVQARDGTRSLCSVSVTARRTDSNAVILERTRDALNASPTCAAAGVTAVFDAGAAGESEDQFPRQPRLLLETTGVNAAQVLTAVHAGPGDSQHSCYAVRDLGIPILDQLHIAMVRLETLASGAVGDGTVTMLEETSLGTCQVQVPTRKGETAAQLAARLHAQFQAPGVPGPNQHCPSERNARDVSLHGDALITAAANTIKVCTTDAGVGFSIRSEELKNVHPIADAGPDQTVQAQSEAGATVALDGTRSSDPDSTPGTNDDIVQFTWGLVAEDGSVSVLADGETVTAQLPAGAHTVRLRVTDKGRLRDTDDVEITVKRLPVGLDPRSYALIRSLEDVLKTQDQLLLGMGTMQRELLGSYQIAPEEALELIERYRSLLERQQKLVRAFQALVDEIARLDIEAKKQQQSDGNTD
jgi:hypothetical protein